MKYKITQDQLDRIVFPFLDKEFEGIEKYEAANFNGYVFKKPDEALAKLGYEEDGHLTIHYSSINKISLFFSLEYSVAEELIGRWAKDRLQIKLIETSPYPYYLEAFVSID